MTVKDLIAALSKLPQDSEVFYPDGDYMHSYTRVTSITELTYTTLARSSGIYINIS
jgi:hypothetical protein